MTMRGLSHNLCVVRSEVSVKWFRSTLSPKTDAARCLNLLVVPWPLEFGPTAFRSTDAALPTMDPEKFGFFEFAPTDDPDGTRVVEFLRATLESARRRVGRIDGVVLPECAIAEAHLPRVQDVVAEAGGAEEPVVPFLLAGIRGAHENFAVFCTREDEHWRVAKQHKHHRWCLDERQIHNYSLASQLPPFRRWWEDIDIPRRSLQFVCANGWLTQIGRAHV